MIKVGQTAPGQAGGEGGPIDKRPAERDTARELARPACPACGARTVEQQGKLVCSRCHTICDTCCEGGPG